MFFNRSKSIAKAETKNEIQLHSTEKKAEDGVILAIKIMNESISSNLKEISNDLKDIERKTDKNFLLLEEKINDNSKQIAVLEERIKNGK